MTIFSGDFDLSLTELREVAAFAAACARPVLPIFEGREPADARPRTAIESAEIFAKGGKRSKSMRDAAWATHRAAREARDGGHDAASEAARAALAAASAGYLHPLAKATQVKHILGPAAHAARALELTAPDNPMTASSHLAFARTLANPVVVDVLRRFPAAPSGGKRVGELIRQLDGDLRRRREDGSEPGRPAGADSG